jgi:Membrane protein involved in the export of O-antigen and teichoic acid
MRKRIFKNAGLAVAQVIVTGLTFFVVYRYLLETIGIEQVGIWSVVLAATSASRISELGLSGSVVKFVAEYLARDDSPNASWIIQTAVISIGGFLAMVLLSTYLFLVWVLEQVIPQDALAAARAILPYAVVCLWLTAIAGVFQAALDGCNRVDLRSFLIMGSSLGYLGLVFALVPGHGLMGLAYAQIGQAGALLVVSWVFLRRQLVTLPVVPWQWRESLFRKMIGYGMNFQLISIAMMLFDPVTKALLSRFGGLGMAGHYEMANRMIVQFRTLLVAANQVLVPVIARMQENAPEHLRQVYQTNYRLLVYLALPFYSGIIGAIPLISELWMGRYEAVFVSFSVLVAIGWFLNTLVGPANFANLGTGRLRWNVAGHLSMGVLNAFLGLAMGWLYGGLGVVIASVLALAIGSWVIVIAYHKENTIPLQELLPKEDWVLLAASILGLLLSWGLYHGTPVQGHGLALAVLGFVLFGLVVFVPLWYHPMRCEVRQWLTQMRFKAA